jgi:Lon-like ATP-dependent protease
VAAGQFHVWAIRTVDEGIELLTGIRAGERGADGQFPEESVYGRVDCALRRCAEHLKEFAGRLGTAAPENGQATGAPGRGSTP